MKVRRPPLKFTSSLPHWAANRAFAHAYNAASTTLPHLEPYLNVVMGRARDALPEGRQDLKDDIALFIGQESNHYRLHRRYNDVLHRHYPGVPAFEAKLKAEYDDWQANRSLKFNVAYSEGFECLGIIYTEFWFERIDDLLEGADPDVVALWRWHLAEEFEHRTVCYDAYKALFGQGVDGGWLYRLYGLAWAFLHLAAYGNAVGAHLRAEDAKSLSPADRKALRWQFVKLQVRLGLFAFPRLLRILSPFYNPARIRTPRGSTELLGEIDRMQASASTA
jgi:uncharacterized protein